VHSFTSSDCPATFSVLFCWPDSSSQQTDELNHLGMFCGHAPTSATPVSRHRRSNVAARGFCCLFASGQVAAINFTEIFAQVYRVVVQKTGTLFCTP